MDEETEVATLISRWLDVNAPEWQIDWGDHDAARPQIVRWKGFNPIAHMISGHRILIDYRYPQPSKCKHSGPPCALEPDDMWLDIYDPEFFPKLKTILKKCEETFNY